MISGGGDEGVRNECLCNKTTDFITLYLDWFRKLLCKLIIKYFGKNLRKKKARIVQVLLTIHTNVPIFWSH